ncbi:hypothetical protein LV779_17965 [Streptomyces thinghirensis]|nr:hypothetical protein [Streptomyces thinghirensis]
MGPEAFTSTGSYRSSSTTWSRRLRGAGADDTADDVRGTRAAIELITAATTRLQRYGRPGTVEQLEERGGLRGDARWD